MSSKVWSTILALVGFCLVIFGDFDPRRVLQGRVLGVFLLMAVAAIVLMCRCESTLLHFLSRLDAKLKKVKKK